MSRIWVPRGRRSGYSPSRYVNRMQAQPAFVGCLQKGLVQEKRSFVKIEVEFVDGL